MSKELSWEPVRRGLIYCSPGCGGGCKITAFDAAGIKAARLVRELGEGWEVRVWENLGWHYAAVLADAELHVMEYEHSNGDKYWSVTTGTMISATSHVSAVDVVRLAAFALRREADKWAKRFAAIPERLKDLPEARESNGKAGS